MVSYQRNRLVSIGFTLTLSLSLVLLTLSSWVNEVSASPSITYYVAADGSDQADGLSVATPWSTIARLNQAFQAKLIQTHDRIRFRRGDTWRMNCTYSSATNTACVGLIISKLASTGNVTSSGPLLLGSYGNMSLPQPRLTGMATVTNWTQSVSNPLIWYAPGVNATSGIGASTSRVLTVNGAIQSMGRFPNVDEPGLRSGYNVITSVLATSPIVSIQDTTLDTSQDWTGGELVRRSVRWVFDRQLIVAHNLINQTLNTTTNSGSYVPQVGWGYFIQNHLATLDQFGEWFYDSTSQLLYIHTGNSSMSPNNSNNMAIEISSVNVLIDGCNLGNITLQDLELSGSNQLMVNNVITSLTIDSSMIVAHATNAINMWGSTYFTAQNSFFRDIFNTAIQLGSGSSYGRVVNNTFMNIGMRAGMGTKGDNQYSGMWLKGDYSLILNNTLMTIGYNAIDFNGAHVLVAQNIVSEFTQLLEDGGGIYTWGDSHSPNRTVRDNIISQSETSFLNQVGAAGTNINPPAISSSRTSGIYLDDYTHYVNVTGNTIIRASSNGIFLHNANNSYIMYNHILDCQHGLLVSYDTATADRTRNLTVQFNTIVMGQDAASGPRLTQDGCTLTTILNEADISQFGVIDNQTYISFPFNHGIFGTSVPVSASQPYQPRYDLDAWRYTWPMFDQGTQIIQPSTIPTVLNYTSGQLQPLGALNTSNSIPALIIGSTTTNTWLPTFPGCLGGCLNISVKAGGTPFTHNSFQVNVLLGDVVNGTTYSVQWRMFGNSSLPPSPLIQARWNQHGTSYAALTPFEYIPITSTSSVYEIVFTSPITFHDVMFRLMWWDTLPIYVDEVLYRNATYLPNVQKELATFIWNGYNSTHFKTIPDGTWQIIPIPTIHGQQDNITYTTAIFSYGLFIHPFDSVVIRRISPNNLVINSSWWNTTTNSQNNLVNITLMAQVWCGGLCTNATGLVQFLVNGTGVGCDYQVVTGGLTTCQLTNMNQGVNYRVTTIWTIDTDVSTIEADDMWIWIAQTNSGSVSSSTGGPVSSSTGTSIPTSSSSTPSSSAAGTTTSSSVVSSSSGMPNSSTATISSSSISSSSTSPSSSSSTTLISSSSSSVGGSTGAVSSTSPSSSSSLSSSSTGFGVASSSSSSSVTPSSSSSLPSSSTGQPSASSTSSPSSSSTGTTTPNSSSSTGVSSSSTAGGPSSSSTGATMSSSSSTGTIVNSSNSSVPSSTSAGQSPSSSTSSPSSSSSDTVTSSSTTLPISSSTGASASSSSSSTAGGQSMSSSTGPSTSISSSSSSGSSGYSSSSSSTAPSSSGSVSSNSSASTANSNTSSSSSVINSSAAVSCSSSTATPSSSIGVSSSSSSIPSSSSNPSGSSTIPSSSAASSTTNSRTSSTSSPSGSTGGSHTSSSTSTSLGSSSSSGDAAAIGAGSGAGSSSSTINPSTSSSISTVSLVGIIIGSIFVVSLLFILGIWYYRSRASSKVDHMKYTDDHNDSASPQLPHNDVELATTPFTSNPLLPNTTTATNHAWVLAVGGLTTSAAAGGSSGVAAMKPSTPASPLSNEEPLSPSHRSVSFSKPTTDTDAAADDSFVASPV